MIILLTGADTYRSQRRFEQLRDAFRQKHDASGMNTISLDGQTATAEQLRGAINTQGFFSSKRFVGLNHWQPAAGLTAEAIHAIVGPHADSRDVIAVIRTESQRPASGRRTGVKRRSKGGATASGKKASADIAGATVETFEPLDSAEVQRWIPSEAKRRGGQIDTTAVRELAVRGGTDLWRLHHELDKLLAYAKDRSITTQDVATLVPAPEVTDMFSLTDAVGHQRQAVALKLLEGELSAGTHPLAIVSQLTNHIATLRAVQRASENMAPAAIASHLAIHPFVVKKALDQSRTFTPDALATWHHRLVGIDATLKSSPLDAATLLDVLIVSG